METYRLRLQVQSTFLTPWHADTIFGHLCWVIAYTEGEAALQNFLAPFLTGEPPFLISNGFPGDLLPKPLTAARAFQHEADLKQRIELLRRVKGMEWVTLSAFNAIRQLRPFEIPARTDDPICVAPVLHNTISRTSGTTSEVEGGLFELMEFALPPGTYLSVYLKANPQWAERVRDLFHRLSHTGFGAKKSTGKGAFRVQDMEPFPGFETVAGANAFVSLSNFVPSQNDPTDGLYRVLVKYGKLGEEFALAGNPFKKPLIFFRAGAVFRANGSKVHGGMLKDVACAGSLRNKVVQYGYAFDLPATI